MLASLFQELGIQVKMLKACFFLQSRKSAVLGADGQCCGVILGW